MKIILTQKSSGTAAGAHEWTADAPTTLRIGRAPDCDLVLNDPLISPHHSLLTWVPGTLFIEDLESINGTYVNDRRVREKTQIKPADHVSLPGYTLAVEWDPAPAGSAAAAAPAPPRNTRALMRLRLLLILMLLVLMALGFGVLKMRAARAAPAPGPAAPAAATPAPTPTLTPEQASIALKNQALSLAQQGTLAFFNGDVVGAARLFNQSLAMGGPSSSREYLDMICDKNLPFMLRRAYDYLANSDYANAGQMVANMMVINSNATEVQEFEDLLAGQQAYDQAGLLIDQGRFEEARALLVPVRILRDADRLARLRFIDQVLGFQAGYQAVLDKANALDWPSALAGLDTLQQVTGLAAVWQDRLGSCRQAVLLAQSFQAAVTQELCAAVISLGPPLLTNVALASCAGFNGYVSASLADLRARLAPQAADLARQAQAQLAAGAAADAAGNPAAAWQARAAARGLLMQVEFVAPTPAGAARLAGLAADIATQARTGYQTAYVQFRTGNYTAARDLIRQTQALLIPGDPLAGELQALDAALPAAGPSPAGPPSLASQLDLVPSAAPAADPSNVGN